MRPHLFISQLALCALLAVACGGGDDEAAVTTTAETVASTTTAPEPTSTTTTTAPTTSAPATTDTVLDAGEAAREQAEAIVLGLDDFAEGWEANPPPESSVDYNDVPGCSFVEDLQTNDGSIVQVESQEFTLGDLSVRHEVRVYDDVAAATDVVLVWAEQATVDCVVDGAEVAAADGFETGELAPFTEVEFSLQAFEDLVGEPRVTNLELTNTLIAPDQQAVFINDAYFIQVGPIVSGVFVFSPDRPWDGTSAVLDLVAARMVTATE